MASPDQIKLIRKYEGRAGRSSLIPEERLLPLDNDGVNTLLDRLRHLSRAEYLRNPNAKHTRRPSGMKKSSEVTTVDWLEKLYRELEMEFDREHWLSVQEGEVYYEIGRLEEGMRPKLVDIDLAERLQEYAEASKDTDKEVSAKQIFKIQQELAALGVGTGRDMHRHILQLSGRQASDFIRLCLKVKRDRSESQTWQPPTWTPTEPVPTRQEILDSRSGSNTWTSDTVAVWGVPWPLPQGWRERLEMLADRVYGPTS